MRCRRCNNPHYQQEAANKHGGYGRLLQAHNGYCPVCWSHILEQLEALQNGAQTRTETTSLDDYA